MRKLLFILAASSVAFVMPISLANAQTSQGLQGIHTATQNFTPVQSAACQGPGPWCGPGYVRACNRWHCWCRPCY
jgi:hypothetical protein